MFYNLSIQLIFFDVFHFHINKIWKKYIFLITLLSWTK